MNAEPLMPVPEDPIPVLKRTEDEIKETIAILKSRMDIKAINRIVNAAVKEGYKIGIEILETRQSDFNQVKLNKLKTIQGKAIAACACDYLLGDCEQKVLCNMPIKDKP